MMFKTLAITTLATSLAMSFQFTPAAARAPTGFAPNVAKPCPPERGTANGAAARGSLHSHLRTNGLLGVLPRSGAAGEHAQTAGTQRAETIDERTRSATRC